MICCIFSIEPIINMFISLGYFEGCSHCELVGFIQHHEYCERGAQTVGQGILQEKIPVIHR